MNLKLWKAVFAQIDTKNAVITLRDGTGTPIEMTIKLGEGNLTYTESRTVEYTPDRGILDEVRLGDEVPVDVSLDSVWEYITGGTDTSTHTGTAEDFMKRRGVYATNVSTDADTCRPYAIDIVITYEPDCTTEILPNETIVLADFRYESIDHDFSAGTLAFTGKCNVTEAVATRSA